MTLLHLLSLLVVLLSPSHYYSKLYNLNAWRQAQISCESNWNPRATSEIKPWKQHGIDTTTAVLRGYAAAGLAQFIWSTACLYGAETVDTRAADDTVYATDIYNPHWSIRSHKLYTMYLRRALEKQYNRYTDNEIEPFVCAAYNCGLGGVLKRCREYVPFEQCMYRFPKETQHYVQRIQRRVYGNQN